MDDVDRVDGMDVWSNPKNLLWDRGTHSGSVL